MIRTVQISVILMLPTGNMTAPMKIEYDDGDAADTFCEINVSINGIVYRGRAESDFWASAFADLQRNLPQGVKLACCMTCSHGNMCPYGSSEDELFCTKDLLIRSKSDVCDLFDQTDPFTDRMVRPYGCCDSFQYQSDEQYTYNDYLFLLDQKL